MVYLQLNELPVAGDATTENGCRAELCMSIRFEH
jgi:hypothetical protein